MFGSFLPIPPIIVEFSPLLILALSIWITGGAVERLASRFGIAHGHVAGLTPTLAVIALATARLATVAPHWRSMAAHPLDLLRITDGLSFTAGAMGGIAATWVFAWRSGYSTLAVMDLFGAVSPLGLGVSSAGCLLREDCFGRSARFPFGIVFDNFTVARYPVELYGSAAFLILFTLLNSRRFPPGQLATASIAAIGWIALGLDRLRLHANTGAFTVDRVLILLVALAATAIFTIRWLAYRQHTRKESRSTAGSRDRIQPQIAQGIEP